GRALELGKAAEEPFVAADIKERAPLQAGQPQGLELVQRPRVAGSAGEGLTLGHAPKDSSSPRWKPGGGKRFTKRPAAVRRPTLRSGAARWHAPGIGRREPARLRPVPRAGKSPEQRSSRGNHNCRC